MKLFISFLIILPICIKMLFANYYPTNNQISKILPLETSKTSLIYQQATQITNIQNNYIYSQNTPYNAYNNTILSIAQNRDIRNYVKKMAIFGYNYYWGARLDMLMTGLAQKNTALTHLNSYYTYEKNKYDTYTYQYTSLKSTTHWYNYLINTPISIVYRFLADKSYDNLENINKIYNVIVY